MELIAHVEGAVAFYADFLVTRHFYVGAHGTVPSSGWSDPRLCPRFYIQPPADGIWDFDFLASGPTGVAAQVMLPIAAAYEGTAPSWITGIRVHGADNQPVEVAVLTAGKVAQAGKYALGAKNEALVERVIAIYDDSFQPTGTIHWDSGFPPIPHIEMKKLRHELTLKVTGPDEGKIRQCIDTSLTAGTVAAIVAAFASGGWAAAEAFAATAMTTLESCLGGSFEVKLNDRSHWITWDT